MQPMQQTTTTETIQTQPGAVPASTFAPGQGYYSGPVAVQQKKRNVVGKFFLVLGTVGWIITSILAIIGSGLVLGGIGGIHTAGGILYIIAFCIFTAGSVSFFLSDLISMKVANRSFFSWLGFFLWFSSALFVVTSILLIIAASLYTDNFFAPSLLAGDIIFIIAWSMFFVGTFLRWLGSQYASFEFAKPLSIRGERFRAWSMDIAMTAYMVAAIFLDIGAVLYIFEPHGHYRVLELAGAILWIIGFGVLMLGSVFDWFSLTPANPMIDRRKWVQEQQVVPPATA